MEMKESKAVGMEKKENTIEEERMGYMQDKKEKRVTPSLGRWETWVSISHHET